MTSGDCRVSAGRRKPHNWNDVSRPATTQSSERDLVLQPRGTVNRTLGPLGNLNVEKVARTVGI
jgi:hypothetical protein